MVFVLLKLQTKARRLQTMYLILKVLDKYDLDFEINRWPC